jgi:hypothetical protein
LLEAFQRIFAALGNAGAIRHEIGPAGLPDRTDLILRWLLRKHRPGAKTRSRTPGAAKVFMLACGIVMIVSPRPHAFARMQ